MIGNEPEIVWSVRGSAWASANTPNSTGGVVGRWSCVGYQHLVDTPADTLRGNTRPPALRVSSGRIPELLFLHSAYCMRL